MGFNIEQYQVGEEYSNLSGNDALRGIGTVCVNGSAIYNPATYVALGATKKGREKISENRQICQARKSDKQTAKGGGSSDVGSSQPPATVASGAPSSIGGGTDTAKSNTGLYIGIGVGVLVIGVIAIVLIRKK
jgi:hypothetical protein